MIRKLTDLFFIMVAAGLAGDLLYLYFIQCWYDPYKPIEYFEVVFLFIVGITGVLYSVYSIKNILR